MNFNIVNVFQMFTLHPLTIVLPPREDKDHPAIDLDLHLPFFCFQPQQLLQVLDITDVTETKSLTVTLTFGLLSAHISAGAVLSPAGTEGCAVFC